MKKSFVLDTNVLLHDPHAIYKFMENDVLIPLVVVEEIDKFKRDQTEVGRNARTVSRLLDRESAKGSLSKGVELENGGKLQVVLESQPVVIGTDMGKHSHSNDNWILGVALHQKSKRKKSKCILVTKDTNLRIKAHALGLEAEDYFNDKVRLEDFYSGTTQLTVTQDQLDKLHNEGQLATADKPFLANQFVLLNTQDDAQHEPIITQFNKKEGALKLTQAIQEVWGIRPLNMEQRLAMELLLDPAIKLVSLVGKAGTGKTLLAIAAGLHMVVDREIYSRLLVSRPVQPLGRDLGYLPGDVDEKLRPWMQPIFDNLEYILSCSSAMDTYKGQPNYQYLIDKGFMSVEPLTYMRGRSIPNQYMIVDEAQNLSAHEIKSIVTRAGHGTKIVLTGDPEQIDNPFLDASSNGLSFTVNRLKDQGLFGHVTLTKGERSELAELASNLL